MIQKVSVAAIIQNEGKVLVVRRSAAEKFFSGFYELPGGKVDFGESPKEALVREVLEETGLVVKVRSTFDCRSYMSKEGQQHNIEIFLVADLISSSINLKLSEEHDAYLWVDLSSIDDTSLKSTDPIRLTIESYFSL